MESSMLRLNDHCLSNIFDKLNLRDQLRLTAVCERFRDVIVSVQWRSRFRRFVADASHALSKEESHSLLKIVAHSIEHLVINPDMIIYLRSKFPVLRVLEIEKSWFCSEVDIEEYFELIAAHCPLIEKVYLHEPIVFNPYPYIVGMRHLRVLHLSHTKLEESDLQEILTLPLTELGVYAFFEGDSFAETLVGARDLRVFRMHYYEATPDLMESIVDLASTTERDSLTVYITFEIDDSKDSIDDDDDGEDNDFYYYYMLSKFQKYKRSLKALIDDQLPRSTHTILLSENQIECTIYFQKNKK